MNLSLFSIHAVATLHISTTHRRAKKGKEQGETKSGRGKRRGRRARARGQSAAEEQAESAQRASQRARGGRGSPRAACGRRARRGAGIGMRGLRDRRRTGSAKPAPSVSSSDLRLGSPSAMHTSAPSDSNEQPESAR